MSGSRESGVGSRRLAFVLLVAVLLAAPASGQEPVAPETRAAVPAAPASSAPSRFEVTVLGGVFGGADLGQTPAIVLTNDVPTSGKTELFTTQTSITQAPLVEGRLGVRLTRSLWMEGGVSYARPDFAVDISDDVEGAPNVTATSPLTQLIADAGVQYRWVGRRVSPFVMGGGGYLRQLDEPRTTVETGAMFYAGGGLRVRLSTAPRGLLSHLAVRGDARVVWLRGGIRLTDERGPALVMSGGLSIAF